MSFYGKVYALDRQENLEAFVESLASKIPEQFRQVLLTRTPTTKFTNDGDSYTLISGSGAQDFEIPFKNGVEFEEKVVDQPVKNKFTVEGNTITHTQTFVKNGVVITYKRDFSGDELVTTITNNVWDGVARRYYKA